MLSFWYLMFLDLFVLRTFFLVKFPRLLFILDLLDGLSFGKEGYLLLTSFTKFLFHSTSAFLVREKLFFFYSVMATPLLYVKSGLLSSLRHQSNKIDVSEKSEIWLTFFGCLTLKKVEGSRTSSMCRNPVDRSIQKNSRKLRSFL